jgi:hypothetical protein
MTTTIANTPWDTLPKNDLILWASTHPEYKKSMGRQKKEVLVRFLVERNVCHSCEPPITATTVVEKIPLKKTLSRMTKEELFIQCKEKEGFDASTHGKTRATMLDFLRGLPTTKDTSGTSPVRIGTLIDAPEDPQVLRQAILRLLMDTEPFRADPEIRAKLDKIV